MVRRRSRAFVAFALLGAVGLSGCNLVGRLSIPDGGSATSPTSAASADPSVSGDGRYVAFTTDAADLFASDDNATSDVVLRDASTGTTTLVSRALDGTPGQGASSAPAIAADGSVVAFTSAAADLVAADTNGVDDVFVWTRATGTVARVSVTAAGGQVSGASGAPAVSADGRYVAFASTATDLVAGDTNAASDVFVHDRTTGATTRVSVTGAGAQVAGASTEPSISGSGDWVAFTSTASNLASGDSNGVADVFVARRTGGSVRRFSAPDTLSRPFQQSNGASARPSVIDPITGYLGSGEPLVAYESQASNLAGTDANGAGADVFVTTLALGSVVRTVRVSGAASPGIDPALTGLDGGPGFLVAYVDAHDGGAGDVVVSEWGSPVDGSAAGSRIVSLSADDEPADGGSRRPAVGASGHLVAFDSTAGDLVGRTETVTAGDVYPHPGPPPRRHGGRPAAGGAAADP